MGSGVSTIDAAPGVGEVARPGSLRYLPHVLLVTTLVAVVPVAAALILRASGVISSSLLSLALAIGLSLAASCAGGAYWKKHHAGDVVFSELLLWGWLYRRRVEHKLADATELLGLAEQEATAGGRALDRSQRTQLLAQLAGTLEAQDVYLSGHSRRVARHAVIIARRMGLAEDEVAKVGAAAAIHDVGKLRVPKEIIDKPGPLTPAEFEVIKLHPVTGAEMVAPLEDPELTTIVRHHHERIDGTGYPDRLAADRIPLGARIIAVADTFDAVTSARPYRSARRHQEAIDLLREVSGTQLDPDAVRAFLGYYSGFRPVVVLAIVTATARRAFAWLSGESAAASTLPAGKLLATTAATAVIGVVAAGTPVTPRTHAAVTPSGAGGSSSIVGGGGGKLSSVPASCSAHRRLPEDTHGCDSPAPP